MPPTREIVTTPSSIGWRSTSMALLENSGNSSKNSTPLWAREISPGRGMAPPPDNPAVEMVWWGERKGLLCSRDPPASNCPAIEWIMVASRASWKAMSGRMEGSRFAIMLLPEPGEPSSRMLWLPLAAISKARLATFWPFTSAKSGKGRRLSAGSAGWAAGMRESPRRWAISWGTSFTGYTCRPCITAPSRALSSGTNSRLYPASCARAAMGSTPRTRRTCPERESSPKNTASSKSHRSWRDACKRDSSRGRSYIGPSLRLSAGARFMVMRLTGKSNPQFFSAARTLSRDSFTAASGRPTTSKAGRPPERSVSTSTGNAFMP